MESIIYSFNVSAPLFLVAVAGFYLFRKGMVNENFISICNVFVFNVALPSKIFFSVYESDFSQDFSLRFIFYYLINITSYVIILWGIYSAFVKNRQIRSALIHCGFRSNYSIVGLSLATNIFAPESMGVVMMLMPIVLLVNNVFTVIILSSLSPQQDKSKISIAKQIKNLCITITKNPLIIATAIGLALNLMKISLPQFASTTINYFSSTATPLALLAIGAQMDFKKLGGNIGLVSLSTVVKLVIMPIFVVLPAFLIGGFTNGQISALFLSSAVPLAVSSYIMAENMNSDAQLTSQIVLSSTLFSTFTLIVGIVILKSLEII